MRCLLQTILRFESVQPVATAGGLASEDFEVPSEPVLTGRLKNSEYLRHVNSLSYLSDTQRVDLVTLLNSHIFLLDTPSRTNLFEHDIDVGDAKPIHQRSYGCP